MQMKCSDRSDDDHQHEPHEGRGAAAAVPASKQQLLHYPSQQQSEQQHHHPAAALSPATPVSKQSHHHNGSSSSSSNQHISHQHQYQRLDLVLQSASPSPVEVVFRRIRHPELTPVIPRSLDMFGTAVPVTGGGGSGISKANGHALMSQSMTASMIGGVTGSSHAHRRHPDITPTSLNLTSGAPKRSTSMNMRDHLTASTPIGTSRFPGQGIMSASMMSRKYGQGHDALDSPASSLTPSAAGAPKRSVSMTRLNQLAQPRRRYLEETIKWRACHLGNLTAQSPDLLRHHAQDGGQGSGMVRNGGTTPGQQRSVSSNRCRTPPAALTTTPVPMRSHKSDRPRPKSSIITNYSSSTTPAALKSNPHHHNGSRNHSTTTNAAAAAASGGTDSNLSSLSVSSVESKKREKVKKVSVQPLDPESNNPSLTNQPKTITCNSLAADQRSEATVKPAEKAVRVDKEKLKRDRDEKERKEREERLRQEEEDRVRQEAIEAEEKRVEEERNRQLEEEQRLLAQQLKRDEEEKLRKAIEEQQKRQEEERKRQEEEHRLRVEREEQEVRAKEEAEKARLELEERLRKDEEERIARKKVSACVLPHVTRSQYLFRGD